MLVSFLPLEVGPDDFWAPFSSSESLWSCVSLTRTMQSWIRTAMGHVLYSTEIGKAEMKVPLMIKILSSQLKVWAQIKVFCSKLRTEGSIIKIKNKWERYQIIWYLSLKNQNIICENKNYFHKELFLTNNVWEISRYTFLEY